MSKNIEKSKFSKRVKRYASVTGVVGGLTAKMASQKLLGLSFDNKKHAKNLTTALGKIKGPLMKLYKLML